MNSNFTRPWIIVHSIVILSAFLLTGCFGKVESTKNSPDFAFFKTPGAEAACVSTNISQWELSGHFLHNFLSCASNRSEDGDETLSGLQDLLAKLDETKLQKVLDFVLTIDPKGSTHEERYPYLLAVTTLLDRGIIDGRAAGLNLTSERLGPLQDFLVTLDTTRTKDIVSAWSRSGHLAEVLNQFGAFVDQLQDHTLESTTHEILAGQSLRPHFLYLAHQVLGEDLLFTRMSDVLAKRKARVLNPIEQSNLLSPYRESTTASDVSILPSLSVSSEVDTTTLGLLAARHSQYSASELNGLSAVVSSLWSSYQKLAAAERRDLDARIADSMNTVLGQQSNPVKWLLALFHDANSLDAKDLGRITFAVDQLLEEGNNISLEAIRAKTGASKLMNHLQNLLTVGGKIPLCPLFDKPSLDGQESFQEFTDKLNTLSTPSSACGNRIPFIVAIESIIGAPLGDVTSTENLWKTKESDAGLNRTLVLETIGRLKSLTIKDPYALYELGLAKDRVELSFLNDLEKRLQTNSGWTFDKMATLDDSLSSDYTTILEPDFLEKLLTYRIEKLASQSYQFANLSPAAAEVDAGLEARTSRIFAGLYSDGPMEQLIAEQIRLDALHFTSDQQDLKSYLQNHPSVWSRILFKAKEADGIFRSPSSGALSGETVTTFSGAGSSIRAYLGFDASTAPNVAPVINPAISPRILQPIQSIKRFSDDEDGHSGWALWDQYYASGPLTAKDVPVEISAKLLDWYTGTLIPTLSQPTFWPELDATTNLAPTLADGLSRDYYDVINYSPEEARRLTIYYLKQYQKLSPSLPDVAAIIPGKSSAPSSDLSAFADPIRGFFNTSFLVKDDSEAQYTTYSKYFPTVLGTQTKVSALKNALLPDYAAFQAQSAAWNFVEQSQVNDATRLPGDTASPFALLSTLDLLTFSKPQTKFIPQSVVGFGGKICRSKTKDPANSAVWTEAPAACPLEFQGSTEEEAYNKFREYVSQTAIQTMCPLLATDTFGPRMMWTQRLALSLDNPSFCPPSARSMLPQYRFPEWHSARVLNDIFAMGKSAKLKDGLVQLPSALRFYKLKHKNIEPHVLVGQWLNQSKGIWSEHNAADQRRREFFAGGFWVGSPTLLNSYLNLVSTHIDSYTWRNTLITYSETDDQGVRQDTLRNILRLWSSEQKASAAAGQNAFTFGLNLLDKIGANSDNRQFSANFLAHLNTSESYDFFANEFPMATIQLFPADTNPFEWTDKGISFAKYFGQHSSLKTWQIIGETFTASELDRLLTQVAESMRLVPDLTDRAGLLAKLSNEIVELGTLYRTDDSTYATESLEGLTETWRSLHFGLEFRTHFAQLVTRLSEPIEGLEAKSFMNGEGLLENLMTAVIKTGPAMVHAVQEAGKSTDSAQERDPLFWRNWVRNLLDSAQNDSSFAMASFLSEKRFDLTTGSIWLSVLHPTELQNKAVAAIGAVDSVPEDLWRQALLESTDLFARVSKALNYLKTHIVWRVNPNHNAYQIALNQLFELSTDQDLRDKQVELVTLWLPGTTVRANLSEINK